MSLSLGILSAIAAAYILYRVIKTRHRGLTLQKALDAGALVIDVRSPEEYASGHFGTAINIPYQQIESHLDKLGDDTTRPIILYCYAGSRSAAAERVLRSKGFANIINARNLDALKRFDRKK